jgi:ABC-type amino acid transport substrate-binding protein
MNHTSLLQPLALALAALITPVAHAAELNKIAGAKAIVVAHRETSLPFSYLDANKAPIGYSMDLCAKVVEAVRKHLKLATLEVKYLPVTSSTRIPAITEGKASLECGSTTNNAERRLLVDYTIAHFVSSSRLLVKTASKIDKLSDLNGKTVVSTAGTSNLKTLARLNEEQSLKLKIIEAKDHAESFAKVSDGTAAAFAMDDVLLFGLRANSANPADYAVIGKPMTIEPYAIMLPKGDAAFKKVVDDEMRRIILSGEVNALYKKWFQSPIPPKGITLDLPMPFMLKESFKYPSDKVGDLK